MKTNYKIYTILSFLLFVCALNVQAQQGVSGQTYKAKTSESCKMKTDGGCTITEFNVLAFGKDSVTNYNEIYGFCSPADTQYNKSNINPKKYAWREIDGKVYIEGFEAFAYFSYSIDTLTGYKTFNGELKFTEFFREIYEE